MAPVDEARAERLVLQAAKVIYGGFDNWEVRGIRNLRRGVPDGGLTVEVVILSDDGRVLRLEGAWDGEVWTDALIDEGREDAKGKGGKRKPRTSKPKCSKGRPCGMSCISQKRNCRVEPSPAVTAALTQASSLGGGTGGGAFPTSLPADHVVTTSKRITAARLDKALDAIDSPGAKERVGMFRAFVAKTGVQSVFADTRESEVNLIAVARQSINDPNLQKTNDRFFSKWVTPAKGAEGYTGEIVNHVVVSTSSLMRWGEFRPVGVQLNDAVTQVLKGADDDYILDPMLFSVGSRIIDQDSAEFVTYLHEMGHQIHFKAGSPSPPVNIAGSATDYGATNEQEWFAEHFALWMLDASRYATADPVGSRFIEDSLNQAIDSPLTMPELRARATGNTGKTNS